MTCPSNPVKKKFLFWEYDDFGDHKWITTLLQYDHFFKSWKIHGRCKFCNAETESRWINDIELLSSNLGLKKVPEKGNYSMLSTWIKADELEQYK